MKWVIPIFNGLEAVALCLHFCSWRHYDSVRILFGAFTDRNGKPKCNLSRSYLALLNFGSRLSGGTDDYMAIRWWEWFLLRASKCSHLCTVGNCLGTSELEWWSSSVRGLEIKCSSWWGQTSSAVENQLSPSIICPLDRDKRARPLIIEVGICLMVCWWSVCWKLDDEKIFSIRCELSERHLPWTDSREVKYEVESKLMPTLYKAWRTTSRCISHQCRGSGAQGVFARKRTSTMTGSPRKWAMQNMAPGTK